MVRRCWYAGRFRRNRMAWRHQLAVTVAAPRRQIEAELVRPFGEIDIPRHSASRENLKADPANFPGHRFPGKTNDGLGRRPCHFEGPSPILANDDVRAKILNAIHNQRQVVSEGNKQRGQIPPEGAVAPEGYPGVS